MDLFQGTRHASSDEGVGVVNTGCRGEVLVCGFVAGAVVLTESSFFGHNPSSGSLSPLPTLTFLSRGCYIFVHSSSCQVGLPRGHSHRPIRRTRRPRPRRGFSPPRAPHRHRRRRLQDQGLGLQAPAMPLHAVGALGLHQDGGIPSQCHAVSLDTVRERRSDVEAVGFSQEELP